MKRKNPFRREDDYVRVMTHQCISSGVAKYFCLKELCSEYHIPYEIHLIVMYLMKEMTRFPVKTLLDTLSTELPTVVIERNLRRDFPNAQLLVKEENRTASVRAHFKLMLDANGKDILHLTIYETGSVVAQNPGYSKSTTLQTKLHRSLDPLYTLFLHYKEWNLLFI